MASTQQYSNLSDLAYQDLAISTDVGDGFSVYAVSTDLVMGYSGAAFLNQQTGEMIVAHRGTDRPLDLLSDSRPKPGALRSAPSARPCRIWRH